MISADRTDTDDIIEVDGDELMCDKYEESMCRQAEVDAALILVSMQDNEGIDA